MRGVLRTVRIILALLGLCMLPVRVPAAHKAEKQAATPPSLISFNPVGGVFTNPVSLQLTCKTPGVQIHYTIDGSEPTAQSPIYSSPIALTNSTFVRARTFGSPSNTAALSQSYLLLDPDVASFDSNLPLVIVDTLGQEIDKGAKTAGSIRFIKPAGKRTSILGPPEFDGRALINLRGRASLRYPKRSYTFRPVDEQDQYMKVSFLGLPSDSDWILYGPYPDKTFIRDVLAYELSNQMGQYASRTRFVELFVNEAPGRLSKMSHMGLYVLEEKIRRGKDRVDIAKLGPEDNAEPKITGGYIFKKDHTPDGGEVMQVNVGGFPGFQGNTSSNRLGYPSGPGGFPADPAGFLPPYNGPMPASSSSSSTRKSTSTANITNRIGLIIEDTDEFAKYRFSSSSSSGSSREHFTTKPMTNEFYYVLPEVDEITAAQRAWLIGYLNKFETVLSGKSFADPVTGYRAYIDPPSFIDHHIIVEMSKNVDGFRFSAFFHKDRGGKIKMGPIWDWNLSFGNANGKQGWMPEYWLWPQLTDKEYAWFRRLFQDPDFGQQYVDRWAQLRTNVLATGRVLARVDELTNLLNEAQIRNYDKWPILGRQVWPQYTWGNTYAEEVGFMKDWITKRFAWIDAQFLAAPVITATNAGARAEAPRQLTMTAPKGEIYFTVDGSDPRQSGGKPAPNALKYSTPIGPPKSKLFARSYDGTRWSASTLRTF